jgi:hypothetical protein
MSSAIAGQPSSKLEWYFFLLGTAASKDRLGNGDLQILFP